jgi:hypothetical protein
MEERIRFIEYKGKQVLLEDLSGIREEDEFIALLDQATQIVRSQPPKSVLVIVDLTQTRFNERISRASKAATAGNTPYIRASVLVGVSGLMEIMMRAVSAFAHRELVAMRTREEALEWLDRQ